tara:strand:+ start:536 stop:3097 length:2562 start_codon:yes stop_codon:yes gene_type:complete
VTYSRVLSTALLVVTALVGGSLATTSTAAADVIVVVEAGDSLSEIAAEYGVSVSDLMVANGITNPDRLYMGQELIVPGVGPGTTTLPPLVVVVQSGDSLSSIATDYGVTVGDLVSANGIDDPDRVHPGQELVIPGVSAAARLKGPTVVAVRSGDSLSEIAAIHGVSVASLMAANDLDDPDLLQVGQLLTIPGTSASTTTLPPLVVTVVSGESLSVIAARYDLTVGALAAANGITDPNRLSVGQDLVIPGRTAPPKYSVDYGPIRVDGRGWGHGRGMGQYGALGYAVDEGWTRDAILDHYYGGTIAGIVPDVEIGVRLLGRDGKSTTVHVDDALLAVAGSTGAWTLLDASTAQITLDGDADRYRVAIGSGCGGPFTDTGLVVESPITRIRPARLVDREASRKPFMHTSSTIPAVPSSTVDSQESTTTTTTIVSGSSVPEDHPDHPSNTSTSIATTTTVAPPDGTAPSLGTDDMGRSFEVLDASDLSLDQTLQVCAASEISTWYRGEIRAARYGSAQRTVNWVRVEQYLRGVVPREMSASWATLGNGAGRVALEVQAVAARSYALAEVRYAYAKTCDTIRCQVYGGRRSRRGSEQWSHEAPETDAAVVASAGLVRLDGDGVVSRTEFSASTGGHTITADFPGVVDAGDDVSINPVHRWTTELDASEVAKSFGLGALYEVEVIERDGFGDDGGRATEVELRTRSGERFIVNGNRFRREFGLRSNWFGVLYGPPDVGSAFPSTRVDEYRVTTDYSDEDLTSVMAAAEHLEMSLPEFQRAAVWVVAFLLNLSDGDPASIDVPVADGSNQVTTAYFAGEGDQTALEQVAKGFDISGEEAQRVSVTVLVFLTALAKAAGR